MKNIIGTFGTMLVLAINIFICAVVSNAGTTVAAAKEFKAAVVAEIENSNFNPNVIEGCIKQAREAGYELQVTNCVYDENNDIQLAEVVLTYVYELPLFGISETRTTRGIAR
ncbi:MAG: hypothetical protein IJZ23_00220 [Roseburia sp.]|nr:hypothetical protein [Roseburia sp.]